WRSRSGSKVSRRAADSRNMRFLAVALLATACGALPSDDPGDPATRAARAFAASSTALMGTSMGEPGQVKTQPTASCSAAWLPHVSASASRHMLTGATGSATFAVERGDGVVTARASFSSFTLAPMTEGFTFDGELDYYGTRVTLDISTQELT